MTASRKEWNLVQVIEDMYDVDELHEDEKEHRLSAREIRPKDTTSEVTNVMVPIDVYKCYLDVYFGENESDIINEMITTYPDLIEDYNFAAQVWDIEYIESTINGNHKLRAIMPVSFVIDQTSVGVIAHEALHIAEKILAPKGVHFPSEAWNYLVEYVTNELWDAFCSIATQNPQR